MPRNPRLAETNIYDNTDSDSNTWENRRRTTFAYAVASPTDFNLVSDVYEYDSNATTLLRSTHTDYNQTSTYQNRRIIGLPTATVLYDGGNNLFSKVEYLYDESGYLQATSATPTQHDSTSYGIGFLAGRGNQTTVRRYDVTNQSYVEWKTGYNITGSPTFSRDPRYSTTNAQVTISYTDAWVDVNGNNTANLNTFSYPTTVTDPDGYSSTIKYDFQLGAVRFATDPKGAVTEHEYKNYGRRWKTTTGVGSGSEFSTELVFDSLDNWVKSYSSIESGQPDFYSITVFDGHDRVRATVSDHPGSTGQYKAVYRGYDTMGRMTQSSNPTEINSTWNPTGDDAAGWAWSYQTYDWQGRPLVSTNQDGSTRVASYTGCGCAGSDVTTLQGEPTTSTGPENRRSQKFWRDIFGRTIKSQVLNYDGTPYKTTLTEYNTRNQATTVKEFKDDAAIGTSCPLGTCEQTDLVYDGHGRLQKRYLPVYQDNNVAPPYNGNPSARSSNVQYYSDDTVNIETDPRGATATYSYNNRKLISGIGYYSPNGVATKLRACFRRSRSDW